MIFLCNQSYNILVYSRNAEELQAHLVKVQIPIQKQFSETREAPLKNNTNTFINNTNPSNITNNSTSIKVIPVLTDMTINDTRINGTPTPLIITKLMEAAKNRVMTEDELKKTEPTLPLCDVTPPDLGKTYNISNFKRRNKKRWRVPLFHWLHFSRLKTIKNHRILLSLSQNF